MKLNLNFYLWMAALGSCFLLEAFGLFKNRDYTLTTIIRTYIPVWARAGIWGWLAYHFIIATPKK